MRFVHFAVLSILLNFFSFSAFAAEEVSQVNTKAQAIVQKIKQAVPSIPIVSIEASDLSGFYDVTLGNGEHLFVTADGETFIAGDMFKVSLDGLVNLTETKRNSSRATKLADISEEEKIVFSPAHTKASITVFTDVDCGYCRKLHSEMAGYLEKGIEIKYLAFPRAGLGSQSYKKIVSAWCASDRQLAMTKLKSGKHIETKNCENPVASHYQLGNEIGVRGTPAIVLESGELLPGYYPPEKLSQMLHIQ